MMKAHDLKLGLGDEKGANKKSVADLETAIQLVGFGKFHAILMAICGLCFLSSGLEYGLHAYTLPYARCDLQLTTAQMGLINAMFLSGSIACSVVCGAIADAIGRKKVIMASLLMSGTATFLSSFSPNVIVFIIIRFISGFMIGVPGCLVFSYAAEFCSDLYRTRVLCIIGFCWTFAWLVLPAGSWLIIPSSLSFETSLFKYNTWRTFVALFGGLPSLLSGLLIYNVLPETPKFLFVRGYKSEAIETLRKMYHLNTGNPPENYPVTKMVATHVREVEDGTNKVDDSDAIESKTFKEMLIAMAQQIKQIYKPPLLKKTIHISAIYFSNFFGYYGLGLWLPELFNRFQSYYSMEPNGTISVCELSTYQNLTTAEILEETPLVDLVVENCENRSVNLAVFTNTFIIGASCGVGNLLAIILSKKFTGRMLSFGAMLISGICSNIVYFSRSELQIVIVNCFFMTGVATSMTTIGSCIVNLFPTSVRAAGVCVGILFGRLGAIMSNLIFGLLLDISCEVPFFFLGGVIIVGAILCYLLPKDSQKAMEE